MPLKSEIAKEVENRTEKIKRAKRIAQTAKEEADYQNKFSSIAGETIKGLPNAARKIGSKVKYYLGGGEYGAQQNKRFDLDKEIKDRQERGLKPLKGLKILK